MSANLGWVSMTTGQTGKEALINSNNSQLDAALTEELSVDVTSGTSSYTLNDSQTQSYFHFQLTPNGGSPPTAGQLKTLALGAIRKFILVSNDTAADFTVSRSGGATIFVGPFSRALIYIDGTGIRTMGVGSQVNIQRVRLAVDTNVTIATALNSGDTIQGVSLTAATDEHVLLFAQSTASQNGVYKTGASPARSNFAANTGSILPGTLYFVTEGTYAGQIFYCTNTTIPVIATDAITFSRMASSIPYVVGFHFPGTPTASALVWSHVVTDVTFTLPDELVNSVGRVATNPSSSTAFDVKKNGVSVGTITVSSGGAFTFTTSGGTVSFAQGDYLDVVAPASLNGLADLTVTLRGAR